MAGARQFRAFAGAAPAGGPSQGSHPGCVGAPPGGTDGRLPGAGWRWPDGSGGFWRTLRRQSGNRGHSPKGNPSRPRKRGPAQQWKRRDGAPAGATHSM